MRVTEAGRVGAGLGYFRVGHGAPLVYLPGLTPDHRPPRGLGRWFQVGQVRPFARHREVWWLQRPEGLRPGTTFADIADAYAGVLAGWFPGPVDVVGSSTGGSLGLQLAADHPGTVRRLVLLSSACRLGAGGRRAQRELARLLEQGRDRKAGALMMSMLAAGPLGATVLSAAGWLAAPAVVGHGDPDLLLTIAAEDAFDLTGRLPAITTPTLVVGGARDRFYGTEVFTETVAGLPRGRLLLHQRSGHVGAQSGASTVRAVLEFLAEDRRAGS